MASLMHLDSRPGDGDRRMITAPKAVFRPACRNGKWTPRLAVFSLLICGFHATPRAAEAQLGPEKDEPAAADQEQAPARVEVEPTAQDDEIRERLMAILSAAGWFTDTQVKVDEGVVFLAGRTDDEAHKRWAGDLARNIQDVVAVVNRIEINPPNVWDFSPAHEELNSLSQGFMRALPLLLMSFIVLLLAWGAARLARIGLRAFLRRRVSSGLLREVAARTCGILVFLLGLYIVLRVSGLTRLAVTVVGGTGLIGLVVGIAFRDITENFLASLFLSFQQPFREGDLVEIGGTVGFVQRLTSRTTVLMNLDGNQVQVPNATVFKSTICNYTSSPNRREHFAVGIGYDDPIAHAQEVALGVLAAHPAVLKEPEPWVLVDNLGAATVNLRVYFWLDGSRHSWLKVRSSVIRLIKRAFHDAGISLPDESREVIFPDGVPVRMLETEALAGDQAERPGPGGSELEVVSTAAEAGLESEAKAISDQARGMWSPDRGENLLAEAAPDQTADDNRSQRTN
jgi:small conductance mechanosensitive channel